MHSSGSWLLAALTVQALPRAVAVWCLFVKVIAVCVETSSTAISPSENLLMKPVLYWAALNAEDGQRFSSSTAPSPELTHGTMTQHGTIAS